VQAARQIAASIGFYAVQVLPSRGSSWGRLCDAAAAHLPAWEAQAGDLVDEVRGIAEGAGYDLRDILALNCRGSSFPVIEDCTSFSVGPGHTRTGHALSGQNWDQLEGISDSIVLLHVVPEQGPRHLQIVEAGQLGRQGMNDLGLSLQANGLPGAGSDPRALPAPFTRRRLLGSATFDEALDVARATPRPHASHLLLSHRDSSIAGVEGGPTSTHVISPDHGWMVHANHYLGPVPEDLRGRYRPDADSLGRQRRADDHLARAVRDGVTASALADLCRDHAAGPDGVCVHADVARPPAERWATVASIISDLTDGVMAVAAGPPCRFPYVLIDVSDAVVRGTIQSPAGSGTAESVPD
jgi:isopenicillin-N N-acyltransferase-like protein